MEERRTAQILSSGLAVAAYSIGVQILLDRPVFVIGCGRSGTTLVGELLNMHRDVQYVNENRSLWAADPRSSVWGPQPAQIILTQEDATPEIAELLMDRFLREAKGPRQRLVEKTPINSFRIPYIDAIFPDALYVLVIRDGRDVAASIAERCKLPQPSLRRRLRRRVGTSGVSDSWGPWYGKGDVKWIALRDLAAGRGVPHLEAADDDFYLRGLVEWRLATSQALRDLDSIPEERRIELRYEELQRRPREVFGDVLAALGLCYDTQLLEGAAEQVSPRLRPKADLLPEAEAIAGPLLQQLRYAA